MFEDVDPDVLVREIEASHRLESVMMARRCAAIAELLARRTDEAEAADPDPGFSLITGFRPDHRRSLGGDEYVADGCPAAGGPG